MMPIAKAINDILLIHNVAGISAATIAVNVELSIRDAVNSSCNCGGKPLSDGCCPACEVWHRLIKRAARP